MKAIRRPLLLVLFDLAALGAVLIVFALFHHVLPRDVGNRFGATAGKDVLFDFPGRFTDGEAEEWTEDGALRYRDGSLDLTLIRGEAYGSSYVLADFYVRDLSRFSAAFAGAISPPARRIPP